MMPPRPTTIAAVLALALAAGLGTPARAEISIIDNDRTIDVDCAKDPEVSLVGNHLTLTARGVCAKLTISGNHATVTGSANVVFVAGNHNTVTLAAADDVTIAGNNNTLTVRKSVKLKAPRVADAGTDNHITQPK
jgi:catabolite regulation protein CreA